MKKNKNIELKIYELLGIKIFRNMLFKLIKILLIPITRNMTKEDKDNLFNSTNNYSMKKGNGLQDLIDFKKQLKINTTIHLVSELIVITNIILLNTKSISFLITSILITIINSYCIMLQRYNSIRINKVIEKYKGLENKKKDILKVELKKQDSLLKEHTYKIIDNKKKETEITFDNFLDNASLEQLKKCLECINILYNFPYLTNSDLSYVNLKKKKKLKLELKEKNDT